MRRMVPWLASLAVAAAAQASEPPKPVEKPAAPQKPSGLTGNFLPHCEPGTYRAGNQCKPAPPGFYAPASTVYPVRCPDGKTSAYGSRSVSDCR